MLKPKKALEGIIPYSTDKYKQEWRLKLDSNENSYGCSSLILNTIKNTKYEDVSLYPCYGKLIDKLKDKYELKEDNFLLTNGCDEALSIIINAYIEPQDEIISMTPSFSMPLIYAKSVCAKEVLVDYAEKFVFNKEGIKESITSKTKIVYIATPNNPTGEVVRASVIETLLKEYKDILFMIDCTYVNYSSSVAFEDYVDMVKKYDNIVVVKSFSKDFALAGLRLGFVVADSSIINSLKKISSPYNVNAIALNCAIVALSNENIFEEIKEQNEFAKKTLFEGLKECGYLPYPSEGNFILCDFASNCDFYYDKFRKNGVIVRNFPKASKLASCLRITVPKLSGVKYILELLAKKNLLIFDLDGVVFDVSSSYTCAIKETFKYFAKKDVSLKEIQDVKNLGGMNCDWDATKCLLTRAGYDVDIEDIISVFQDLFFNPKDKLRKKEYLIDKEKLLISKETFENLTKDYDLVVFSGRLKDEVKYSLEKFDIEKYFYYFVTSDDLPKNMLKPNPRGVLNILNSCPHKEVKYFGDSVDDIIAGNAAGVKTIGVIPPNADSVAMANNFKHLCANYIIEDIKGIENFLKVIESENVQEN